MKTYIQQMIEGKNKEGIIKLGDSIFNPKHYLFSKPANANSAFMSVKDATGGEWQYLDLLGNITNQKTEVGQTFYDFVNGTICLKDIDKTLFLNQSFYSGIIEVIDNLLIQAKRQANDLGEINQLVNNANELREYVYKARQLAYEQQSAINQ